MANPLLKRKPREVSALSAITAALSEAALSEAVVSVPSVVPSVVSAPPPRSSRKRKRNSARRRRARSNSNKPTASFWRTWTICSISSETDHEKLLLHIYFNTNNSTREKERERTHDFFARYCFFTSSFTSFTSSQLSCALLSLLYLRREICPNLLLLLLLRRWQL